MNMNQQERLEAFRRQQERQKKLKEEERHKKTSRKNAVLHGDYGDDQEEETPGQTIREKKAENKLLEQKKKKVSHVQVPYDEGERARRRRIQNEKRKRQVMVQKLILCGILCAIVIAVIAVTAVNSKNRKVIQRAPSILETSSNAPVTENVPVTELEKQETTEKITNTIAVNADASKSTASIQTTAFAETDISHETETVAETVTVPEESTKASWPPVDTSHVVIPSWIQQDFIKINDNSRPCIALNAVNDIVIHWVANPGSTAKNNRDYFENLSDPAANPTGVQASAQFCVGLEGEVIQCMPLYEMAYAVKAKRNPDTISIEVCHPDETGQFSEVTYNSVVRLTAWLLQQFDLDPSHVLRHYDITGKDCPKYYVDHEDAWEQLKADIKTYYEENPNIE